MRRRPLIGVVAAAIAGGALFLVLDARWRGSGFRHPPDPNAGAEVQLQLAEQMMHAGRWDDAQHQLRRISGTWPQFRTLEVERDLGQSALELVATERLGKARSELLARNYAEAKFQLNLVPRATSQVAERSELEDALELRLAELIDRARALRSRTADRAAMEELSGLADEVLAVDPDDQRARQLARDAHDAIEALDSPWLPVKRAFEAGEVTRALTLARACAKHDAQCRKWVWPLAQLEPDAHRVDTLSTPRLLVMRALCKLVSDESDVEDEIVDAIVEHYDATAKRCRAASNWACVDQQLALAAKVDSELEDETLLPLVNAYAASQLALATGLRQSEPRAARRLVSDVLKLTQIDDRYRDAARQLDEQLAAGP